METFKIENLSFSYPKETAKALDDVTFTVSGGEFITICGFSGCGKTTLLRMLKPELSPFGEKSGSVFFNGKDILSYSAEVQAQSIGFVSQNPETQIVTDKVWHELAFGLENLGMPTAEIRRRVAEMASFFGIQTWFHKKTNELSGGQKQLLNLASVMVMQPSCLILDEPTSLLDPIAAEEFIKTLEKINKELGTTILLSEHRLDHVFSVCDRIIVMDGGKILTDGTPRTVCVKLRQLQHGMFSALPDPPFIYGLTEDKDNFPLSVREGKQWLQNYAANHEMRRENTFFGSSEALPKEAALEMRDVWFRYEKNGADVAKHLNFKVNKGEILAVLGGNGTGKSTMLSLAAGLNKPYRGKILIDGKVCSETEDFLSHGVILLPQNPKNVFVKKTVYLDLLDMTDAAQSMKKRSECVTRTASLCQIEQLLERHPFDLSGGELQRAALAKILLKEPKIVLLDEPTKGMDALFKQTFAEILHDIKQCGAAIIMVSHDVAFCAAHADRCAMFFDGSVTSEGAPQSFFAGNAFYTTAACRMAKSVLPYAVTAKDVIYACGKTMPALEKKSFFSYTVPKPKKANESKQSTAEKIFSVSRPVFGVLFVLLFPAAVFGQFKTDNVSLQILMQLVSIVLLFGIFKCFLPRRETNIEQVQQPSNKRKLKKGVFLSFAAVLAAIPLTLFIGIVYLDDRKYYFISLLILLEIFIPLCSAFESKKPSARELTVIAVMCALAVAGRTAFYMLPQFKPVGAIVIIAGVCLGAESGFLVGAMTAFVSNFFFGQGPWTPWQMFAFGILGFAAGLLYKKGFLRKTRESLCVFGFFSTLLLYGMIMNSSYVIQSQANLTFSMFTASFASGLPFDLVHAFSCAFFLWFMAEPVIEKTERAKIKYGLFK